MQGSKFLIVLLLAIASLLVLMPEAAAGPNCDKKPDHPSCLGGGDDGGGEPPIESNPAVVYTSYQSRGRADLKLANANGSASVTLIEGSKGTGKTPAIKYEYGAWSPDGTEIVFNERGGESRLLKQSIDGSAPSKLYNGNLEGNNSAPIKQPAWHPLGTWIAFSVAEGRIENERNVGDSDVRVVRVDGTDVTNTDVTNLTKQFDDLTPVNPATETYVGEFEPTWSPDGSRLAFVRWPFTGVSTNSQIIICDFDGSVPQLNCPKVGPELEDPLVFWREAPDIFSPAWHPFVDTQPSLIAYIESAPSLDGNGTRADIFIESVDPNDSTCLHIKADNSPYTGTRDGCDVQNVREIGDFTFSTDLAWSCDGQDLLVSGVDPITNDRGTYIISGVLGDVLGDVLGGTPISSPSPLLLPEGGERNTTGARSRLGCP